MSVTVTINPPSRKTASPRSSLPKLRSAKKSRMSKKRVLVFPLWQTTIALWPMGRLPVLLAFWIDIASRKHGHQLARDRRRDVAIVEVTYRMPDASLKDEMTPMKPLQKKRRATLIYKTNRRDRPRNDVLCRRWSGWKDGSYSPTTRSPALGRPDDRGYAGLRDQCGHRRYERSDHLW